MKKQNKKIRFLLMSGVFLTFVFTIPGKNTFVSAVDCNTESECNNQLDSIEKKLKKEKAELNVLQQDLNQINSTLTSTQQLILKVQNLLNQTEQTIAQKESEIGNLEKQLTLERHVLRGLIQEMYFMGDIPLAGIVLAENDLLGLIQGNDNLFSTQEKMQEVIRNISEMRAKVTEEKLSLEDTKMDHAELLAIKNKQKQVLVSEKVETQDDLEDQQATIAELQGKLSELRGALSGFLGKSYSTKDIDDAVKFASKATGIRKEFLQAELIVETGYGSFTGGCKYDDTKNLRMRATDKNEFLNLAKELEKAYGGNYKNKKLSCTPKRNGVFFGYGGAMGVAQFMPTTWIGYKTQISKKTGSTPADPWDLADGITGMAIKLANGGATSKKGEFGASMLYYCGSTNPSPATRKKACRDYATKVQFYSKDPESHF